jgi:ketosteroid isomerase-like protein
MNHDYVEIATAYLAALQRGDSEAAIGYFSDDVVQQEFPNRLVPGGATRDLAALREAAARGKKVLAGEEYQLLSAIAEGKCVAMEVQWIGTLAVPFGTIPQGGQLRARFAIFLEFREDKIVRQHNYDCFEPW